MQLSILVGPEDVSRCAAVANGTAPRLDYRLVAATAGGDVVEWLPPPSSLHGPRAIRRIRSFGGNIGSALRLVTTASTDCVVFSSGETWGLPVALAGAGSSRRRFTHVLYTHRVFSRSWKIFFRRTRRILAVDGWLCATSRQAEFLRASLGGAGAFVAVVSQGVDTSFFRPGEARSRPRKPYILSVGTEMRDYGLLFEAVRGLPVEVVVKCSSAWMSRARNRMEAPPDNVTIIAEPAPYPALRDLYLGASLVVTPLHETLQAAGITTILEAMALEKCVLATRSSGLPDHLVDGLTGAVCDGTATAVRSALLTLLDSPATRCQLGEAGRAMVEKHCSLEGYAGAITESLRRAQRRRRV